MTDRHTIKPFPLRMPQDLKDRIEAEAKLHGRSMNAEIVLQLQRHYAGQSALELGVLPSEIIFNSIAEVRSFEQRMTEIAAQLRALTDPEKAS